MSDGSIRKKIGFIGLGIMGKSMARHLMKAGHAVSVFSRTRSRCEDFIAEGATWQDSVAGAAVGADMIITMVGLPSDVEQVYFGEAGLLSAAEPGTILIDMSTSRPDLAVRIHAEAAGRGLRALDAPVSGGDAGARDGTLSIMVGGDRSDFEAAVPVLAHMGTSIVHLGPAGSGQHCKMANQIAIAGAMLGVAEALAYTLRAGTLRAGLDPTEVLKAIGGGAASSHALHAMWPKMVREDFSPGFLVEHFIKDMTIAQDESRSMGLDLEGLTLVRSLYEALRDKGFGRSGTQALFRHYTP